MAHFARIEGGYVREVIVVKDTELTDDRGRQSEAEGQSFIASLGLDGTWVQTSYSASMRGKYAGIGDAFDDEANLFTAPPSTADDARPLPS